MSRQVRRVPIDFDWPLKETWGGYLMPDELRLPKCPDCDGGGYSPEARHLHNLWYGYVPFSPEDNGSTPLTPETPAVRARAERNVTTAPEYYGTGEGATYWEAQRLADHWNSSWAHHLNADDVAALVAGGRLYDFTHTWKRGDGWQPIDPPVMPAPGQVNEWSILSFGHDSINAHIAIRARCEREGSPVTCATCDGEGNIGTPEQRAAHEAWEETKPPTGEGWQLWETTSEGSPTSPVFASGDELAVWMSQNPCGFGGDAISLETAMTWVHGDGWAPSMISVGGCLMDGVTGVVEMGKEKS